MYLLYMSLAEISVVLLVTLYVASRKIFIKVVALVGV